MAWGGRAAAWLDDRSKDASRHHKTHRGRARLERTAPDLAACKTLARARRRARLGHYTADTPPLPRLCSVEQAVCLPNSLLLRIYTGGDASRSAGPKQPHIKFSIFAGAKDVLLPGPQKRGQGPERARFKSRQPPGRGRVREARTSTGAAADAERDSNSDARR